MKRFFLCMLAVSLLLSGCGLMSSDYVYIAPHKEQYNTNQMEAVSAADYEQLRAAMEELVSAGTETGVIHVADYDQSLVKKNMALVVNYIRHVHPIGEYAVDRITYEIGTSSGKPAIAVNISYHHSRIEIQKILKLNTMADATKAVGTALRDYDSEVVFRVEEYEKMDFVQYVQDYAARNPDVVMEVPQVAAGVYGSGPAKVIALTFTYQNSRDVLRQMQTQVQPVFESAMLYVSGKATEARKLDQLSGFLMERFDYSLETSLTPAYSLLCHGVGDGKAFANVYSAMCRKAGLECLTVTGTRNGEPRTWNIVREGNRYYHVDLLRNMEDGFRKFLDKEMAGYVWDYFAYPACVEPEVTPVPENTDPV